MWKGRGGGREGKKGGEVIKGKGRRGERGYGKEEMAEGKGKR